MNMMISYQELVRTFLSERAVYKWLKNGFLPKTEFFGKTKYASKIEEISGGKYQAREMLEISKKNLLAA
ncbi:DNA-binding protein [Escherichia coli]|uniref:DNA-binding protein n=1 Tax=Escherichia coli TaxID=562 RepID=UPI000DDB24A7|nr:DNA-binding protein [Escherichia coli]